MISVCLAAYENDTYLEHQIMSILCQLGEFDEIVISDDSMSDKVLKLCKKINDKKIKYVTGPKKGVIKNFENALCHVTGDIIFLSDQDDVWLENKVTECKKYLMKYDLVISNAIVVDEDLNIIDKLLYKTEIKSFNIPSTLFKNKFIGCCMAFNKKILKNSLPFPKNIPMHDWWIGLIGIAKGNVAYCHTPLIKYRRHQESLTQTGRVSLNSFVKKVFFRLNLIKSLLIFFIGDIKTKFDRN